MFGVITTGLLEVLSYAFLPAVVSESLISNSEASKEIRKKKREIEKIKSEANMNEIHISDDTFDSIEKVCKGKKVVETAVANNAIKCEKLINYAMYYMANDKVRLIPLSTENKEFVNAIGEYAGFGKIYPEAGVLDLSTIDLDINDKPHEYFAVSMKHVEERLFDPEFQNKWKIRVAKLNCLNTNILGITGPVVPKNCTVDENGLYHPVFFIQDEGDIVYVDENDTVMQEKQGDGITDELFERLEATFVNMLEDGNYCYRLDPVTKNLVLNVRRPLAMGAIDSYLLDDGSILGGIRISIMANTIINDVADTIFVDVLNHPDIVYQVLQNKWYTLDVYQAIEVNKDRFENMSIYHTVDFTNTPWMDNLSMEDKWYLNKNLSAVIKVMGKDLRLRFLEYASPNAFTLTSDTICRSPLSKDNVTATGIENGTIYKVENSILEIIVGGLNEPVRFNIKYEK